MNENIFRIYKSGNFSITPNSLMEDLEISEAALGLMCRILRFSDKFEITFKNLLNIVNCGATALKSRITELENRGYIYRERLRDEKGSFTKVKYRVFESLELAEQFHANRAKSDEERDREPTSGKPTSGKSTSGYKDNKISKTNKLVKLSPANKELNNLNNLEDSLSINNEIECKEETIQDNTKEVGNFKHLQEKYDIKTEVIDYLISVAKSYEVDNLGGYITELIAKIKAHNLERLSDIKKAIPLKAEKDSFLCYQQRKKLNHGMILSSTDQIKDFKQIPGENLFDLDLFDEKEDVV